MSALRKKQGQKAVRVNITLPPKLFIAGQDLARSGLYGSMSGLVQDLLRERVTRGHVQAL